MLKQVMLTISCDLSGEAAGLALGLVMLGSKSAQAIEDMVGYAQETQHEKILRGLAVGIALVMYGRMEEADALIESLCRDKVKLQWSQMPNHVHNEVRVVLFSKNNKGLFCGILRQYMWTDLSFINSDDIKWGGKYREILIVSHLVIALNNLCSCNVQFQCLMF